MRKSIVIFLLLLTASVAGCIKPYHLDDDWWEEKIKARDTDWGPEIKGKERD